MESNCTIERMRWQCRRGMLELDLLLNRFLDAQFQNLAEDQKLQFQNLLNTNDALLYAWLMSAQPVPEEFKNLVEALKTQG